MATPQTMRPTEPEITNYELFILVLSVLSIVNLVLLLLPLDPVVHTIILIVDVVYSLIFLADFFTRLARARSKRAYFVGERGWLDLLGSLPGLRFFRVFRIVRAGRGVRRIGLPGLWHTFMRQRAASTLLTTLLAGIVVLQYASIFVIAAERSAPNANIKSPSDALWWSYVTMTTVGYGDRYPVTNPGRLVGVVLMTLGVGLFGVFTSFLASAFVAPRQDTAPASPQGETPETADAGIASGTVQSDAQATSAPPPADLTAQVERLTAELTAMGQELRQLTQVLREQQGHQSRQEP